MNKRNTNKQKKKENKKFPYKKGGKNRTNMKYKLFLFLILGMFMINLGSAVTPTISISYPTSIVNYGALNNNLTLNFTATSADLDNCWYDYNNINTTLNTLTEETSYPNYGTYSSAPSSTAWAGIRIDTDYDYTGVTIAREASCTATNARLLWSNGSIIETKAFVGGLATFDATLLTGLDYRIETGINGATGYTLRYNDGFTYPKDADGFNYLASSHDGVDYGDKPTRFVNIVNITGTRGNNLCLTGVDTLSNITLTNQKNITIWANDSSNNINSTYIEWDYNLFNLNYTYDSNITESSTTTFTGKFKTSDPLSSSYLQYNNTNYSTSISSLGDNTYTLSFTITSPSVSTDTNITWFFWVNGINTTAYNQTVLNVNLDDCSSYSFYVVNYTLVDELTQENINNSNSTIESSVILKTISGEEIATFNKTFNGTATASICSENNLNTSSLRLWEQSRYGSQNHVFEQHNIQNASITSLPREIVLRDLPSTSATTFRIAYKSATFLPIESAVINIQRKYIGEGIFKMVEAPLTDTSGETSASLDLNSVLYRIVVSKNGETLSTFENPAIACDNLLTGDCSILINERESATLIDNIDIINDFSYGFNIDNRTMTLTFEIPSGENSLVNLFVNQSTILGNQTSCNQTLYATSGQLQCIIDNALGDVYTNIYVYKDGVLIGSSSETIFDDRSQYFGTDNIVLTFFLVFSLVLLMISSPITVLIGLLIGLISSSLMLFLNAGSVFGISSVLTYIVVIIILLIVKISGRER